jgi:hypothetical protein
MQTCLAFGSGNLIPFSCGGALDAPSACSGVRRRRFTQLVFSVWAAILFWEMDNPPSEDGSNPRTMGDMIDRVKMQAVGETVEYVMRYFNLPVPDGGLLYILKSLGMKI